MWPFDLIFFLPTSGYWDNKSVFVPRKLSCKRQVILRCSGANVKISLSSQQLHLNTEVKKTIYKWWSKINGRMLRNYQNSPHSCSILPSSATFTSDSLTSVYSLKRLLTKDRRTTILLNFLFLPLNQ